MKRILAIALCLVMLAGLVFASDRSSERGGDKCRVMYSGIKVCWKKLPGDIKPVDRPPIRFGVPVNGGSSSGASSPSVAPSTGGGGGDLALATTHMRWVEKYWEQISATSKVGLQEKYDWLKKAYRFLPFGITAQFRWQLFRLQPKEIQEASKYCRYANACANVCKETVEAQ